MSLAGEVAQLLICRVPGKVPRAKINFGDFRVLTGPCVNFLRIR